MKSDSLNDNKKSIPIGSVLYAEKIPRLNKDIKTIKYNIKSLCVSFSKAGLKKYPIIKIIIGRDKAIDTKNVFKTLTWKPSYIVNATSSSVEYPAFNNGEVSIS